MHPDRRSAARPGPEPPHRHRLGRILWIAAALAALSVVPAAPAAADSYERVVDPKDARRLVVTVGRGHVEILKVAPGSPLRVTAESRGFGASAIRFAVDRRNDTIRVRATQAEWLEWVADGPRVRVLLEVPRDLALEVDRTRSPSAAAASFRPAR